MADDVQTFVQRDLRGARFVESDLSGVVMRGVLVSGMEIDAPWLSDGDGLLVNGVDVSAYVEDELSRRFPGRAQRRAVDPAGLRSAWNALDAGWAALSDRVAALPADAVSESIDGEWSFLQTLRHLVIAVDIWFGQAVLGREQPFHPIGLPDSGSTAAFPSTGTATRDHSEVVTVWAGRMAMVRDFLADVTPAVLDDVRRNPHEPEHAETVRSCVHVVLEEGWEHLRFATRDVAALEAAR